MQQMKFVAENNNCTILINSVDQEFENNLEDVTYQLMWSYRSSFNHKENLGR